MCAGSNAVSQQKGLPKGIERLYTATGPKPEIEDVMELLLSATAMVGRSILVIDGIDEMKFEDICLILSGLQRVLTQGFGHRLFIASRKVVGLHVQIPETLEIAITPHDLQSDISIVIESTLAWKMEHQRRITDKVEIVDHMKQRLLQESRGR